MGRTSSSILHPRTRARLTIFTIALLAVIGLQAPRTASVHAATPAAAGVRFQFTQIDPATVPLRLRGAGAQRREVRRERFVRFDRAAMSRQLARAGRSTPVEVSLFPDTDLTMRTFELGQTHTATYWSGQVLSNTGAVTGWAVYSDAYATASLRVDLADRRSFALLPVDAATTFRIVELNAAVRDAERKNDTKSAPSSSTVPVAVARSTAATAADPAATSSVPVTAHDGPTVDVLVVYTAAARAGAGGTAQVQNAIAAAVSSANAAYAYSGVSHRLRLVHTYETTSFNSAVSLDQGLSLLQGTNDGAIDEVHRERDRYGADIVLLWHDFTDQCGIAYVMREVGPSFANYAFGAVDSAASCHGGWNVVAHEVGHLFGSQHDVENATLTPALAYAYGYQHELSPQFITVMAYPSPGCDSCPKIPYFSSPSRTYAGVPVGSASADNVKAMTYTDAVVAAFRTPVGGPVVGVARATSGTGYFTVTSDGVVRAFGSAMHRGDLAGIRLAAPIVGMAADPDGAGYWLVAADGGVFAFDARFYGSAGAIRLVSPVVGMAADPDGAGYWLVAADGGIFSYSARFYGSAGAIRLASPVVGMATDPDRTGYWLVAADGGIFSYGARFYGSAGAIRLASPVVGMATDPDRTGYWLVAADGGVFAYAALFLGSSG